MGTAVVRWMKVCVFPLSAPEGVCVSPLGPLKVCVCFPSRLLKVCVCFPSRLLKVCVCSPARPRQVDVQYERTLTRYVSLAELKKLHLEHKAKGGREGEHTHYTEY